MSAPNDEPRTAGYVALFWREVEGQAVPWPFDIPAEDEASAVGQTEFFIQLDPQRFARSGLARRIEVWRVHEVEGEGKTGDPEQLVCAWDLPCEGGLTAPRFTRTYSDQ